MARASRLESALYEEVESDRRAMGQSVTVILLSGVATGVGSLLVGDLIGLLNAILLSVAGWLLCGVAAWVVGTRVLAEPETQANFVEVLRVTGFASAPGLLRVFGVVPVVGSVVFVVTGFWMLVAMVIAIRQTLDYQSTWRALVVAGIAWAFFVSVGLLPLAFG
jgi:hypothetical protein